MFKRTTDKKLSFSTVGNSKDELIKLQQELYSWNEKKEKIQNNFNFLIPDYIIDEIIQNEISKSFVNLHYLVNCALVNERLSEKNANLLKQIYNFK